MSILTILVDIPLYSTIEEALAWGSNFGIQGYHTHIHEGQTGYMSGYTHDDIELVFEDLEVDTGLAPSTQGAAAINQNIQDNVEEITEEVVEQTIELTPVENTTPSILVVPVTTTTTTSGGSSSGGGGGGY